MSSYVLPQKRAPHPRPGQRHWSCEQSSVIRARDRAQPTPANDITAVQRQAGGGNQRPGKRRKALSVVDQRPPVLDGERGDVCIRNVVAVDAG